MLKTNPNFPTAGPMKFHWDCSGPSRAFEVYSRRDCYCWDWFLSRWPEMTWSPLSLPPPRSGWSPRRSAPSAGLPRLWTGSFHRWRRAPGPRRLLHLTTAAFLGWLKVLLTLQTPGKRTRATETPVYFQLAHSKHARECLVNCSKSARPAKHSRIQRGNEM